jgi:hypothetical protein
VLEGTSSATSGTAATSYSSELRWCDACHQVPASVHNSGQWICRGCQFRRAETLASHTRLSLAPYRVSLSDASEGELQTRPVWERFLRWARDRGLARTGDPAADIGTIHGWRAPSLRDVADQRGWVALITAEIAGLSLLWPSFTDSQLALRTSGQVNKLLDDVCFDAVESACRSANGNVLRAEFLSLGGDRVLVLVPADVAPAIAQRIAQHVEGGSQSATEGRRLTLRAGIGMTPRNVPLGVAIDLASDALVEAKRTALNSGARRATIGWAAFGSSQANAVSIDQLEQALQHARQLRRAGLDQRLLDDLVRDDATDGFAHMARSTTKFTDLQRRAVAATLRDLGAFDNRPALRGVMQRGLSAAMALLPFCAGIPTLGRAPLSRPNGVSGAHPLGDTD